MGMSSRLTAGTTFLLGVLCGLSLAGWAGSGIPWLTGTPGTEVAGARAGADRRAAWEPSAIPSDWDAPAAPSLNGANATPTPASPAPTAVRQVTPAAAGVANATATPGATPGATPAQTPRGAAPTPTTAATGAGAASASVTPGATSAPVEITVPATQKAGAWREVTFHSEALGRTMPYLVWLPPGYPRASGNYPVLYLLHGAGDGVNPGRMEWRTLGLDRALELVVGSNEVEPFIVVLPEGLHGYWIDHANGGPRWAEYVSTDVVQHVDRTFRTDKRPERRAVGGLSMGGHAALQLALRRPETFRIAGAHSPSLRDREESPPFFGDAAWFARFDPETLARTVPESDVRKLRVWIDAGAQDTWRKQDEAVAAALERRGAKVTLKIQDGKHEGAYWRANIEQYVRFYGAALKGV
jgi:enterochelin esterase-like enzyme